MKSLLYFCLISTVSLIYLQEGFAQQAISENSRNRLTTGSWQIGLKEGYSRGNILKNRIGSHLHFGYCLVPNLVAGIEISWSREWLGLGDFTTNDVMAGPFVRYQFLISQFSPFIEVSYKFGKRMEWETRFIQSAFINPGLSIRLFDQLRADLSYGLQFTGRHEFVGQAQIGINYLFIRK